MKILFYRYNSIYEPDCIEAFKNFGIEVVEETTEMTKKDMTPGEQVQLVADRLINQAEKGDPFMFVFSINFFPAVSEICEKFNVIYACWSVDCPVMELFATQIKNRCNRVFLFDMAQYERISKYNPECVFYLPLGTGTERIKKVVDSITDADRRKYGADISFVGSLYSEKNKLKDREISDFSRGFIDGIENAQLKVYGYNFIEEALTDDIVREIKGAGVETAAKSAGAEVAAGKAKGDATEDKSEAWVEPIDRYIVANSYIGMELAEKERIATLNMLARDFKVDLYTRSDTSPLNNVNVRGGANSLLEMPKIFNLSKINLNITMRPIQTGLSLRIFDVLASGGFLITNYQAEIESMFTPGVDLEVYASPEELRDKCAYYLAHEDERIKIAQSGCAKVRSMYSVENRMKQMVECMMQNV